MKRKREVPAVPSAYLSPRRVAARTTRSSGVQPAISTVAADTAEALPSDVMLGLQVLRTQFPAFDKSRMLVPVILKNQLYAIVENRTEVDREVDQLKRDGTIRTFNVLLKTNEFAILFTEDYIAQIQDERKKIRSTKDLSIFDVFVNSVLPATRSDEHIPKARLAELLFPGQAADEDQITLLVSAGVLIRDMRPEADSESYWFSVPNIGAFMKGCMKGRQEVVSILKRQRHKEILQEDLETKRLRSSRLGPLFHVRDLIGQGVVESVSTTAGTLLRLIK